MFAGEAMINIRTVAAFCSERKVLDLYSHELVEPAKGSFARGQIAGIFYGVSQFFIFSSYALAMGETLAMAPDLLNGNHMVASMFEVLDRRSMIAGDVGEEITRVEGMIELKNVEFIYARPDVQIFKDFNLRVPVGKSMALVGQSGSGNI